MKKFIALILALMLVFSLAAMVGCSSDEDTTPDDTTPSDNNTPNDDNNDASNDGEMTKEELEATKPGEYIVEKLEAGIPVELQFSGFVDNQAIMDDYAGRVQTVCDEYGISFSKTHAGGDVTQQISQIENYITMGSNIIFLIPPDGATVQDAVTAAQDAGILVLIYGCSDAGYALSTFGDQWTQGYMAGEVMYEYLQQTNPDAEAGSIKVAMLQTREITPMVEKATGMDDSVASHEEFNVVYTSDSLQDLVDDGFNQAENALTYDPEITYIFAQNCIPTLGVCNYISSIPNVDYNQYNVFCTGEDETTRELYELTEAGQASLRGTVKSDKNEGEYMQDLLRMAITGEAVAPYELKFVFAAITAGWDFDYTSADVDQSLNPFAA